MGSDVKSKPSYQAVEIDPTVGMSLFVGEVDQSSAMDTLSESLSADRKHILHFALTDWAKENADKRAPSALAEAMAGLPMSSKIYVFGTEAFLWDIHQFAVGAGFMSEQVALNEPASTARRVFCTHCYTVMENITETPVVCQGCGLLLLVRDHFSRAHGAYVGLNINAEDPSEIPEKEAL
ncbi:MAG: dimethylamine monooxygenase subunit DmmA family protein [Marinomonas sp.]